MLEGNELKQEGLKQLNINKNRMVNTILREDNIDFHLMHQTNFHNNNSVIKVFYLFYLSLFLNPRIPLVSFSCRSIVPKSKKEYHHNELPYPPIKLFHSTTISPFISFRPSLNTNLHLYVANAYSYQQLLIPVIGDGLVRRSS